ncbi:hypothetical protein GCM10010210_28090 [Pseudonocardia hydrocarbonoxydans]|uniref:Uncharacterized protein n=2 Tax=Pseudonocardia hydrocarbonoxydans TaxID=76726 RepID=A0A4Y3WWB4_9PSEU|nr:hypothetical protein PHY01_39390 [Pseudonocardia hydrocarbonoxydans]
MSGPVLPQESRMREPNPNPNPPANRAARRGTRTEPVPPAVRHRGPAAPARPAQGRRISPIRRSA